MRYSASVNGELLHLDLNRSGLQGVEAEIEGRRYAFDVHEVEPGVFWFVWNNRSIEISVTPRGDVSSVAMFGRTLDVEILDTRGALRKAAKQGHVGTAELRAPMPGKIVKVLVAEGDAVELNQGVLVMEAMKMQNEVKSPKAGVVKKIGVQESAAVNAGDLLAIVE